jgi:hypothetical protein
VFFGDELLGQGLPLSNLTAAVNLVRVTWPDAVLAVNEDFCTVVSGFNQQNESVSPDTDWRLPAELDLFSVDWYCGFHGCPYPMSPEPVPMNSSFDPDCAVHMRRVYERLIYPRLGSPHTKVTPVVGSWAPFEGSRSSPCPEWSAGPQCSNPLNASLGVYDAFWAHHASQLWEWVRVLSFICCCYLYFNLRSMQLTTDLAVTAGDKRPAGGWLGSLALRQRAVLSATDGHGFSEYASDTVDLG